MFPDAGQRPAPLVLCILDGWGHRTSLKGNAIRQSRTPVLDRLSAQGRNGLLQASGPAVGLPPGQMGNSEVGHMSIGAGRTILQDLPRIDAALADGTLASHPLLTSLVDATLRSGGACHVLGLLSPGGVHSHQTHIAALCEIIASCGVCVRLHAFLDGRDVPPRSAPEHLRTFRQLVRGVPRTAIATVAGRYWAMDRDHRWDRTERAWQAIARGIGHPHPAAEATLDAATKEQIGDEFVEPAIIAGYDGIRDGDSLLLANFRADRVRQLMAALIDPEFDAFPVEHFRYASCATLTPCSSHLERLAQPLFPAMTPEDTLGETVARAGLRQLRIAETEKYAHVTYFLNGGREEPFEREARILIDSPKVATYDAQPEMSAAQVTTQLVRAIEEHRFDIAVVNYANADMVGHTGDFAAAVAAVEAVDEQLGRVATALAGTAGRLLLTADHGNAEQMGTPSSPQTSHTTNPVPVLLHDGAGPGPRLPDGTLADLAPTALRLLGVDIPSSMRGTPLVDLRVTSG
ncbi:MAG: 2,3-bisphosphoglycerate-independent phosphoglycerate mutase [Rhodospirillales bacterium]|nr:2,3-bisphosphoglycerate-independent phosphoglycerate mutase [Rhodospirillales bacterium]